jgi:hypothetical protein
MELIVHAVGIGMGGVVLGRVFGSSLLIAL